MAEHTPTAASPAAVMPIILALYNNDCLEAVFVGPHAVLVAAVPPPVLQPAVGCSLKAPADQE